MSKSSGKFSTAIDNTVSLLGAVLTISRHSEIESIAHEACKQIASMLDVFTVSFATINLVDQTGQLLTEYISEGLVFNHQWQGPVSYQDKPYFKKLVEEQQTIQFHQSDPKMADAPEMRFFQQFRAEQIIAVPVVAQNDIFGMLLLWERSPNRCFTDWEIAFLELLANNVGIIVERTQLLAESKRRADELETLHDVSLSISSSQSEKEIFETAIKGLFKLDNHILSATVLLIQNGQLMVAFDCCEPDDRNASQLSDNHQLAQKVIHTRERIVIKDVQKNGVFSPETVKERVRALVGLPLQVGKETLGVLQIEYKDPQEFSPRTIHILDMLADRIAVAIKNVQLLENITTQALTDPLTSVPNRRAFERALRKTVAQANRSQSEFCLLYIDLDGFKQVNDRFGHPVGDKTLQRVTGCFLEAIRESDLLARLGGDEFVILLPDTGIQGGEKVAETIKVAFQHCKFNWINENSKVKLGVSIGIVQFPNMANNIEDLNKLGDQLLYQSKQYRTN